MKHAGTEARKTILLWFQNIWETGHVPSMWRKAIVIPILKAKKDCKYTTNYRSISLTSIMMKTMERITNNRLQGVLETYRTINQEKAGFRTHRSTSEHVVILSQ